PLANVHETLTTIVQPMVDGWGKYVSEHYASMTGQVGALTEVASVLRSGAEVLKQNVAEMRGEADRLTSVLIGVPAALAEMNKTAASYASALTELTSSAAAVREAV